MEKAPVPSQAYFFNDNQQDSGSNTKKLGVWLEQPSCTNWQHYVAASRVGEPQLLHFAVNNSVSRKTWNVVYGETP